MIISINDGDMIIVQDTKKPTSNQYLVSIEMEHGRPVMFGKNVVNRQGNEVGCKLTFTDPKTGIPYTLFVYAPEYCDDFLLGVKYKILIRR